MTDRISPSKSFRGLEKNYRTLPPIITNKITDGLSPSESFREFQKNYRICH